MIDCAFAYSDYFLADYFAICFFLRDNPSGCIYYSLLALPYTLIPVTNLALDVDGSVDIFFFTWNS